MRESQLCHIALVASKIQDRSQKRHPWWLCVHHVRIYRLGCSMCRYRWGQAGRRVVWCLGGTGEGMSSSGGQNFIQLQHQSIHVWLSLLYSPVGWSCTLSALYFTLEWSPSWILDLEQKNMASYVLDLDLLDSTKLPYLASWPVVTKNRNHLVNKDQYDF